MYGGDEVSAVVVDVGRATVKAGWAGEDSPKAVFPSCAGICYAGAAGTVGAGAMEIDEGRDQAKTFFVGTGPLTKRRDDMEISYAIEDGVVRDWDVFEKLLDHAFRDRMQINPEVCPVMIADSTFNTNPGREKLVQLMFDKYNVPAVFLSRSAVLSAFSCGRATALVIDSGCGNSSVTPVHEGYVLQKGIVRSPVCGDQLTEYLAQLLERKGHSLRPRYMFNKTMGRLGSGEFTVTDATGIERTTDSYMQFAKRGLVQEIKESVCRVSDVPMSSLIAGALSQSTSYELPDGNVIEVGMERLAVAEAIFNPSSIAPEFAPIFGGNLDRLLPLHEMMRACVNSLDTDTRKDMYGSVVITGGNTLFPGYKERLEKEISEKISHLTKLKVLAPATPSERRFGVWIGLCLLFWAWNTQDMLAGGSILASLGSFQQMWMSRQQYKEHGAALVHKKCP